LVPPEGRFRDLESDYKSMEPMFTKPPARFAEILEVLAGLESRINRS
jgi:hypothetical protein